MRFLSFKTPPNSFLFFFFLFHNKNKETRPDEFDALPRNSVLRKHAAALDKRLQEAKHRTLVHGDAKLANFCFAKDGKVAAVDFQVSNHSIRSLILYNNN